MKEEINTNASGEVSALSYWNTLEEAQVIHLINYDYSNNSQEFNPQCYINIDVSLDRKLLGKDLGMFYLSPDLDGVKELDYKINNNVVSFKVPSLDIYGVVYVGKKENSIYK